jgi:predicted lactoylglutathione lyase
MSKLLAAVNSDINRKIESIESAAAFAAYLFHMQRFSFFYDKIIGIVAEEKCAAIEFSYDGTKNNDELIEYAKKEMGLKVTGEHKRVGDKYRLSGWQVDGMSDEVWCEWRGKEPVDAY